MNSSSTHSICITKDTVLDKILDHVEFELGEFGWETRKLQSVGQKASYLYTAAVSFDQYSKTNYIEKIKRILDKTILVTSSLNGTSRIPLGMGMLIIPKI